MEPTVSSSADYPSFYRSCFGLRLHVESISYVWDTLRIIPTRSLTEGEVQTLLNQHNRCNSNGLLFTVGADPTWKSVKVMSDCRGMDLSSIHDCFFIDNCIISTQQGVVSYKDETTLPAGIAHCTFRNCILFPSIAVLNNTLIAQLFSPILL